MAAEPAAQAAVERLYALLQRNTSLIAQQLLGSCEAAIEQLEQVHSWENRLAKVQEVLEQRRKRRLAGLETVVLEVHLKQGFDAWKRLFDEDGKNRAGICDESRTTCAKVSEDLALVTLHSVDMDKMQAFTSSPDFQKLIEPYVAKHVPYVCTPLN